MTKIESKEDIINLIRKLYVSTYIHSCLDCDINCAGNGVNAHEALSVYKGLARDIGISTEKPTIEELKTLENDPYYQEILRECGYEKNHRFNQMMLTTLNDILGSRDVPFCRESTRQWEKYIDSLYEIYYQNHTSTIQESCHNLISVLQKDLILIKEHTLQIEKENGCDLCGSQSDENCRLEDGYGCPSWNDYKENNDL